ncbi:unnamed protein product [Ranitomeya imitator]|uniref:Uncharacterized protein n=1 Tax=Ranitomeya imitator TaxID=111125 RepID=A0ABN9MB68_9NEOB|nr:unnamed protein product [Ranitomeya imitator]
MSGPGKNIPPPEGSNQESLLTIDMRDHCRLLLCAETLGSLHYWTRESQPVYIYNPYDDSYQTVPVNSHHGCYGPGYGHGVTHVIIRDRRSTLGEHMAVGFLSGALASSALSSFIWMPCWF